MKLHRIRVVLRLALGSAFAAIAPLSSAQITPIPGNVLASSAPGCVRVSPDGSGETLAAKGLTVTVTVLDAQDLPIELYPYQDIWLGDAAGGTGLELCRAYWLASQDTDENGMTTITGTGFAGGSAQSGICIWVGGEPWPEALVPLQVVSADMNGDLRVDLPDLSAVPSGFAACYRNAQYDFAADLDCDGQEDLRDVVLFALDFGASCP